MKARIVEAIFWMLLVCFCLLQLKLLLPRFYFDATDLAEFEKCGTAEVMNRIFASTTALPVFIYAAWQRLSKIGRNVPIQTAMAQSQRLRQWLLLIIALPGTIAAFEVFRWFI